MTGTGPRDGGCGVDARRLAAVARRVGVVGAGSFVAPALRLRLERAGHVVEAVSSRGGAPDDVAAASLTSAVSLCPIWGLVDRLPHLAARGVRRLVAVSSTSRHSKASSPDAGERAVAERLATAEEAVGRWAEVHGARVTILCPTLVYDGVHDRNVTTIAAFIRRTGWFPLVGAGRGLRQPLHADDLAACCVAALEAADARACYDVSGGETLAYREMVCRIFAAAGLPPRFVRVPRWAVRVALPAVSWLLRRRDISLAAFDRMDESLVFDHAPAAHDLGFAPRVFRPSLTGGSRGGS